MTKININYKEVIVIKKYLCSIGVITDDEPIKKSKGIGKRSQEYVSKDKEKESNDHESLTHLMRPLTTKMAEIKQRESEITISSMAPNFMMRRNKAPSSSNN